MRPGAGLAAFVLLAVAVPCAVLCAAPALARSPLEPLRLQLGHAAFLDSASGRMPLPSDAPALAAAGLRDIGLREKASPGGTYQDPARCGAAPVTARILPLALGPAFPGAEAVFVQGVCFGAGGGEIVVLDGYSRRLWSGPATAVAVLSRRNAAADLAFRGGAPPGQIWSWDAGTHLYDLELSLDDRDFDSEQRAFLWIGPV